jgi:diguanylate cyclase (GGDEF)-like protein
VKALIVERLPSSLRSLLNDAGCHDVHVVICSSDALRTARAVSLDLVVLDLDAEIDMPKLCHSLATLAAGAPIVTTGSCDEATVELAMDAGAHDHVPKPIRAREVGARLRSALRLRAERLRHEHREATLTTLTQQLQQTTRDLESFALIDSLTGVANRRHFDHLLHAEWRRAMRQPAPLSIVIVDLDDFHAYNERYGHVGGDACLKRVAEVLAHSLRRPSDVIARYGGEEFVAVLPETDARGACAVAERLRARVEELAIPHATSRCRRCVTLSAGVATRTPAPGVAPETLVAAADTALFRAKREGRNRARAEGHAIASVTTQQPSWPTAPVVVTDPTLVQRMPQFLVSRRTDVQWTRVAASAGDFGRVRLMSRNLAELASSVGFTDLADLALRIADTASEQAPSQLLQHIEELATYLDHVQIVYQRPVMRAG